MIDCPKIFATYFSKDGEILSERLALLLKKMQEGHVCIPLEDLSLDWADDHLFDIDPENDLSVNLPFIISDAKLYTARNYHYESLIIDYFMSSQNEEAKKQQQRIQQIESLLNRKNKAFEDLIHHLRSKDPLDPHPDLQLTAAALAFFNQLTIITGGPGTGKTTTVAKILALLNHLEHKEFSIALCAPTGKAAVRMKESLQQTIEDPRNAGFRINHLVEFMQPSTIHRLLGSKMNSPFFKHNKMHKLEYDVIIVDESSMIGVGLFAKLVDAIQPQCRLIMLGDAEQLASVDSGSMFGDLCAALTENENKFKERLTASINQLLGIQKKLPQVRTKQLSKLDDHMVRLKRTYRYDTNSKMGLFNACMIGGDVAGLKKVFESEEDSLIIDETYNDDYLLNIAAYYKDYIEELDINKALGKMNKARILCAIKMGEQGVLRMNQKIEEILSQYYQKNKYIKFVPQNGFYHNQLIMVTKNLPQLDLFNGDIGIVREKDDVLKAFFPSADDQVKSISPSLITEWNTVYAMTIHKSQGSEFDNILMVLPKSMDEEKNMLTRELIYTGVTRARKKAIIQGSKALISSIALKYVDRISGLQDRLKI